MSVYRIFYIPSGEHITVSSSDGTYQKQYWKSKTKAYLDLIEGINTFNDAVLNDGHVNTHSFDYFCKNTVVYSDFLIMKTNENYRELENGRI